MVANANMQIAEISSVDYCVDPCGGTMRHQAITEHGTPWPGPISLHLTMLSDEYGSDRHRGTDVKLDLNDGVLLL